MKRAAQTGTNRHTTASDDLRAHLVCPHRSDRSPSDGLAIDFRRSAFDRRFGAPNASGAMSKNSGDGPIAGPAPSTMMTLSDYYKLVNVFVNLNGNPSSWGARAPRAHLAAPPRTTPFSPSNIVFTHGPPPRIGFGVDSLIQTSRIKFLAFCTARLSCPKSLHFPHSSFGSTPCPAFCILHSPPLII